MSQGTSTNAGAPQPPDPPPLALGWRIWLTVRVLGRVLWLTRFSVLPLLIGTYALVFNDQAQEVLREFAARDGLWGDAAEFLLFAFTSGIWALNTWLSARLLTDLHMPEAPEPLPHELLFRIWVPRLLGWMAALVVPIAILLASRPYIGYAETSVFQMRVIAGLLFVLAAVFIAWTLMRHQMRWFGDGRDVRSLARGSLSLRELPRFDRDAFLATVVLTLVFFFSFWLGETSPIPFVESEARIKMFGVLPTGAAAILLAALAAWIPFGSALVYLSAWAYRIPFFALLLGLALVSSCSNDNHAIRTLAGELALRSIAQDRAPAGGDCEDLLPPDAMPQPPGARYPLCDYARRWLEARRDAIEKAPQPYPVYIVAAAGGGIRAAYWTAGMLAFRQDLDPAFAAHTLAISGVSGGSLGAVVFDGLVREQREAVARGSVFKDCGGTFVKQPVTSCATAILAGDFLAPTLGVMLYPDLVQRFVPFEVPLTDRARAMERGWESRWRAVMNNDWMNTSYETTANPDPSTGSPLLLLNVTSVEDGRRALVSPLPVAPLEFPDTIDVRKLMGKPMRFSTAAHLSARFMYVSPAATVRVIGPDGKERTWGHLVDGGYFENSGAATALDVLSALQRAAEKARLASKIVPTVLLLSNNPASARPTEDPTATPPDPLRVAVETRAPLETLLQTREGRGTQAQAVLKRTVRMAHRGQAAGSIRVLSTQPEYRAAAARLDALAVGAARARHPDHPADAGRYVAAAVSVVTRRP